MKTKTITQRKYKNAPRPSITAIFTQVGEGDERLLYRGVSGRSHLWQSAVEPSLTYRFTPGTGWIRAIVDHCVMGIPTPGETFGQLLNPQVPKAERGHPDIAERIRICDMKEAKRIIARRHQRDIAAGRQVQANRNVTFISC